MSTVKGLSWKPISATLCFCIMVSFFSCIGTDILFVCSLCRKNLGIASAGAAGLKEFTQSLNGWEVP